MTGSCYMRSCANCPYGSRHNSILCRGSPASAQRTFASRKSRVQREAEELQAASAPKSVKDEHPRENPFRIQHRPTGAVRSAAVASTVSVANNQGTHVSATTATGESEHSAPTPIVIDVPEPGTVVSAVSCQPLQGTADDESEMEIGDGAFETPADMLKALDESAYGPESARMEAERARESKERAERVKTAKECLPVMEIMASAEKIGVAKAAAPESTLKGQQDEVASAASVDNAETVQSTSTDQVPAMAFGNTTKEGASAKAQDPIQSAVEEMSLERENELLCDNDEDELMIQDDVVSEIDRLTRPPAMTSQLCMSIDPTDVGSLPPEELFSDILSDVQMHTEAAMGQPANESSATAECSAERASNPQDQ